MGFPSRHWPTCESCGHPMTFLAQFQHHPERLNLLADGRRLYIFQCRSDENCETWDGNPGSTAAFVMEGEDLTTKVTRPPENGSIELACEIRKWIEYDDSIPASLLASFMSDDSYRALEEEIHEKVISYTKLGGPPSWIQSAGEAPVGDWIFVGALDSYLSFYRDPSVTSAEVVKNAGITIENDKVAAAGRKWLIEGTVFGDRGMMYIFISPQGTLVPLVRVFWQC